MLLLISKLQHNIYEKSEFSDNQARTLDETIQLVKDFPWDAERALTDIQLTGPSVTIQDHNLNYLKLGLYFNGKFCVYYLDRGDHLYEYHAATINDACNLVKDFFDQKLDLNTFEKHFFNIGNKPHFITNPFVYRVNPIRVIAPVASLSAYLLFIITFTTLSVRGSINVVAPGMALFVMLFIGVFIGCLVYFTMKGRHQYLQISRGNNLFSYGFDEQHITVYNKTDIEEIISAPPRQRRNISNIRIKFKNGEIISPRMLIDDLDLMQKFPENLGIRLTYIRASLLGKSKQT